MKAEQGGVGFISTSHATRFSERVNLSFFWWTGLKLLSRSRCHNRTNCNIFGRWSDPFIFAAAWVDPLSLSWLGEAKTAWKTQEAANPRSWLQRCSRSDTKWWQQKARREGISKEAWCFSSLEKVFFQYKELFQHSKGVFSAPGVFSASKLDFFHHPKGIFSTSQVPQHLDVVSKI